MHINLGKIVGLGERLIPIVASAVSRIKQDQGHLQGPEQTSAILDIVSASVGALEGAAQKDIVDDAAVQAATAALIAAIHNVQDAVAAAKAAKVSAGK